MKTTKIMMILALLGGWAGGERKWYPAISGVSQHGIPKRWLIVLFHTEIANFGIIQEDSWFNHLTSMTSSLATQVHPVVVTFIHMGYLDWWAQAQAIIDQQKWGIWTCKMDWLPDISSRTWVHIIGLVWRIYRKPWPLPYLSWRCPVFFLFKEFGKFP